MRVLGQDRLADLEIEPVACDLCALAALAVKPHLDPGFFAVVTGPVCKAGQVEAGARFAVQADKQVQVERGGHTLAIVIRGMQDGRVLYKIHADQQAAARTDALRHPSEEIGRLLRREVSDR